jgi:hypothetical protein
MISSRITMLSFDHDDSMAGGLAIGARSAQRNLFPAPRSQICDMQPKSRTTRFEYHPGR